MKLTHEHAKHGSFIKVKHTAIECKNNQHFTHMLERILSSWSDKTQIERFQTDVPGLNTILMTAGGLSGV